MEPEERIEIDACHSLYRQPQAHVLDVEDAVCLAVPALPSSRMLNRALGITSATSDAALDRAEEFFAGLAVDYQLTPGEPGLERRLQARGLVPGYPWAKFRRGVEPAPAGSTTLRVERAGRERADEFARVVIETWSFPPELESWVAALVALPRWTCYLTLDGDEPAGAAALFADGGVGWLGFGSTRPAFRGRGSQSALFSARVADAAALGVTTLVTETGAPTDDGPGPSYRNILRAGFEQAYVRPNYVRP